MRVMTVAVVVVVSCLGASLPDMSAEAVEVHPVRLSVRDRIIYADSGLTLDQTQLNDLRNGLHKELIFYVDLFREWDIWPDEFISGIRITRELRSDPVKKEFYMISTVGGLVSERRFTSLESLLAEALTLKGVAVASTSGLLPGKYFVKVSVESRIRKLAPIIGYLLFFVPEKEFSVENTSEVIRVP